MYDYFNEGVYDNPFGDLIPRIASRALMYHIIIIEKSSRGYITHNVKPRESETLGKLLVFKNGDHYDALRTHCNDNILCNARNSAKSSNYSSNVPNDTNVLKSRTNVSAAHFDNSRQSDVNINECFSAQKCNHKSYLSCRSCKSVHKLLISQVKSDKGLRICHLNVRSLYGKIDEIRVIVLSSEIDIFCISESFLDDSISNSEIDIPGYDIERRDRPNGRGGGVLMYIKSGTKYKPRPDIGNTSNRVESIWIEIISSKRSVSSHLICCIYRPPSSNVTYYNEMLDVIEKAMSEDKEVVLLGDLNYNYQLDESLSSNPIHYIENLFGLNQLIIENTRVTKSTSTLLDVILTSDRNSHANNKVFKFALSDHYLIYTCIKNVNVENVHKTIEFRSYKNFNEALFVKDISECITFHDIEMNAITCIESTWDLWLKSFISISDRHAPRISTRVRNKHNPWITNEIVKVMYKRDHAHKKAIQAITNEDLWFEYRRLRNFVTSKINEAKSSYLSDITPKLKHDSKSVWKELNRVTGNKKNANKVPSFISNEKLNSFFSSIGQNLLSKLPQPGKLNWKNPECIYKFEFKPIEPTCVLNHLKKLSLDSKLDVLHMDTRLLNISATYIVNSLCCILNASLLTGVIPRDLKIARITPVYKGKGSKYDESNYRPISVIASLAMILEREVAKQVMKYLLDNDLICIDQFAFLKNHSTVTSLHRLVDDWFEAFNEGESVLACFFDVMKCFDSINHTILLQKLSFYGFKELSHKWFSNYLTERQQLVSCNGKSSSLRYVTTGVPQGSALGPLLFILFINDFPQHIKNSLSNIFADDCCVYAFGKDLDQTKIKFQNSVNEANEWYINNNLPVNVPKSMCMLSVPEHISNRLDDSQKLLNTKLNDEYLSQVSNAPYLGMLMDSSLKWNDHVLKLCKRISGKLALLSRLRKFIDKDTLLLLYNNIIQPNIDYAISVWGYTSSLNRAMVTRLQHRAARIICGNHDYINVRGADLANQLGMQSVETRRNYFTATLMFKIKNEIAPKRLIDLFVYSKDTHDAVTRSSTNNYFQVPEPNYEFYRNSFKYQGSLLWNSLHPQLQSSQDIMEFKRLYKKLYFI